MAKSAAEKIGVKAGGTLTLVNPPQDGAALLGALPEGAKAAEWGNAGEPGADAGNAGQPVDAAGGAGAEVVLLFAADEAGLRRDAPPLFAAVGPATKLWIAYRKGGVSDLGRDTLMPAFVQLGWHGVSLVSLDAQWSAARFRRLEDIDRGTR